MSRRLLLPVAAFALLAIVAVLAGGCRRDDDAAKKSKQSVFVVERIVPFGKLVSAANADGSIQKHDIPSDVVPPDAISTVDDVRCLVAIRDLPTGSVLRRGMLAEPSKVGLQKGLTGDAQPTDCS